MDRTRLVILLTGLAIIVVAAVVGYGLGTVVENRFAAASPTPQAPEMPVVPVSPTPTQTPSIPPRIPSGAPTGPDSPTAEGAFRVAFHALPTTARAGVIFPVQWEVHGPAEIAGRATTRLVVIPDYGEQGVGDATFIEVFPTAFEATVTLPERGGALLVAEATIDGYTVRAEHRIISQ